MPGALVRARVCAVGVDGGRADGLARGVAGLMALGVFFSRLKEGLSRSTQKLTAGIAPSFTKRKLDDAALEELEELLIGADLGPAVAARIIAQLPAQRFGREVTDAEVKRGAGGGDRRDPGSRWRGRW